MWKRIQGQPEVLVNLYHSPFYPLKLKATHKETLIKAVSSAEYNERMNYGAMATRTRSSSCCSDECKLTWYSRKTRQVWGADRLYVRISGNLCYENEPAGFDFWFLSSWVRPARFKCTRETGERDDRQAAGLCAYMSRLPGADMERSSLLLGHSKGLLKERFLSMALTKIWNVHKHRIGYKDVLWKGLPLCLEPAILHREYSR